MKGIKKGAIFFLVIALSTSVPLTILAEETILENEYHTNEEEFIKMINLINLVKEENPSLSNEDVLEIVNKKLNNNLAKAERGISDTWNTLTDSEKKLVIRYPFLALDVNKAKNIALEQTELKFGYNGLGDKSDAFRHGMWNAEMTVLIGYNMAELFATAHEDKDISGNESDGYSKEEHKNMDLHNNSVGREIGIENLGSSKEIVSAIVYQSVNIENTEFIWLHD